ncbi:putative Zinc finger, BED-type [Corchorus olitorius]|uniref:Zinc finger, BED-type n=1 Tax=Corchorus olitorius TaxID=93759 RepID=A0A1R3HHY1_9ROSI|nr:putative Zinc finger, BED-type [Corchorus olitorius]
MSEIPVAGRQQPSAGRGKSKQAQPEVVDKLPRKRACTSSVWEHATKFDLNGYSCARCNYCGATYKAHPKKNGTTSLRNHIESCAKNPLSDSC